MDIASHVEGGICSIEFNRPEKKNAITAAMYAAMADALESAEKDAAVRVILFSGAGGIFTAGNDLEDFMKQPPAGESSPVFRFMEALRHASKPVVAVVGGAAIGIGTTMLLHCDLVYASENAKLSLPFVQLGLCPEFGSSLLLPLLAGHQRAAEKLMLGEPFSAQEAQAFGLVNRVVGNEELHAFARAQAAKLAALPASSLRETKRLMKAAQRDAVSTQMADEGAQFRRMLNAPEAKEAFTAFFEKRKPDFSRFA
ncbi:enoyl-CoA hydratase [Noviherbaspirillum pedocola]|uniref:Enoyl-CoA hydratase n=1 Tax=Noviherbaspirillum pedocola TaxID=2801341 RepID=A0A934SR26_9BURK|nr:enoyl-CoA hydratase [Noviherbaspirillum pedocola]MBK4733566.1 enoyl-CoA hydratase [Noviherbaspirillum pedocola]